MAVGNQTLEVSVIEGDGVGSISNNSEVSHLTKHAYKLFKFLRTQVKNTLSIDLKLKETDIFTLQGRKDIVQSWLDGETKTIYDTRSNFAENSLSSSDLFIKFPGVTLTNSQIISDFLVESAENNPSDEDVVALLAAHYKISEDDAKVIHTFLRTSPNDWLRNTLKQTTIYRPFPEIKDGHKPIEFEEGQSSLLDIVPWNNEINDNFYGKTDSGEIERSLSVEAIENYCDKVIAYANFYKKTLVIPTKSTITKFEAEFLRIFKNKLALANIDKPDEINEKINYIDVLTDSFLESLAHNKYPSNRFVVASVPNVMLSLSHIADITKGEIDKKETTFPERHFFRGATKDGYNEAMKQSGESISETNTLEEYVSKTSIQDAYQKALELGDTLTLVVDDSNNPNNDQARQYANEITNGNFKCITLGEYMFASITNPRSLGKVFVGSNVIGDYVSDFNAGIACSALPPGASLGIAPSVDSNGKVLEANPAAGTAPGLANDIEKSKKIVPTSILLSITLALEAILNKNKDYNALQPTVQGLKDALLATTQDYINRKEKDYSKFTDNVIEKTLLLIDKKVINN